MTYVEVADTVNGQLLDKDTINQFLENIRWLYNGRARYFYQRLFTDSNYSINTSTFTDVDATNMACTLVTSGNPVRVRWCGALANATAGQEVRFDLLVDGATFSNDTTHGLGGAPSVNSGSPNLARIDMEVIVELAAGSHTFKLQWATSGGTVSWRVPNVIQFEAYEI